MLHWVLFFSKYVTYKETEGKVVDYKYNYKDNGVQLGTDVIEYVVGDKTYKRPSNHYVRYPEPIGTVVKIKYNPKNQLILFSLEKQINIFILE